MMEWARLSEPRISMNTIGWIQLLVYVGILLAITKPLGIYLF